MIVDNIKKIIISVGEETARKIVLDDFEAAANIVRYQQKEVDFKNALNQYAISFGATENAIEDAFNYTKNLFHKCQIDDIRSNTKLDEWMDQV